jgi:hypothetical protein
VKYDFKVDSFTINVPTVQIWGIVYVHYPIFSGGYEVPTLNNTYTKTEVDNDVASKANQSSTYTKTEVDNALANIATLAIASWSSGTNGYRYLDTGGSGLVNRTGINNSAMQILGSDNTGVIGKAMFYKGIDVNNIYISNNCFSSNIYAGYYGSLGQEYDTTKYRHKLLNNYVTSGTPVTCQFDL